MMLATVEEEKPPPVEKPAAKPQPKPAPRPEFTKDYLRRKPRRAQLLDLQDILFSKAKKHKGSNQEFLALVKTWTELESLLQAHNRYQIDKAELPKSVAKSLSAVAEDDPAAASPATDPKV